MNFNSTCAQLMQRFRPPKAATDSAPASGSVRPRERSVDDDTDPALARKRQNALLDFAIEHIVSGLHEVEWPTGHDLFELAMAPTFRRRDTDIAHAAGSLHRQKRRQMFLP